MTVDFPSKLRPLFTPSRWKSIRGGRDGGKSWGVARALLERGASKREFIVCARETMESIKDSVHRLLVDQIEALGMQDQWDVEKAVLRHRFTGTEIVFRGLKNPDALKSLEGATIVWIEEAQTVSAESWRKVPPTVRRDGSEIWLTWNPELETDPTWQKFVVHPPPGMIEIIMNFSDNPWASKVLQPEREQMRIQDPDEYQHVWLGQPKRQIEGAVYAKEIRLAEEQGRIGQVPYHDGVVVRCGWDLGDSDIMAVWFIQSMQGQHRVIDYYENRHEDLDHYLNVCESKGYKYGEDYFPWDAASKVLANALETTMRQRGRNVRVLPRMSRDVGIDRVREMLGTCWFDIDKCADGLNRLRYYRYGQTSVIDPRTGDRSLSREPLHDDNSHGADALRSFAMGYRMPKEGPKPIPPGSRMPIQPPPRRSGSYSPFG